MTEPTAFEYSCIDWDEIDEADEYEVINKDELESFNIHSAANEKLEKEMLDNFLSLALEDCYASDWKTYTIDNTDDYDANNNVRIEYKYNTNERMVTIRSTTVIGNADMFDFYKYCNKHYLSSFFLEDYEEEQTTVVKKLDKNHKIMYSTVKSPNYWMKPRDFCYVQKRFKVEDYCADQYSETFDYVVGCMCYTNNDHPYYVNTRFDGDSSVRGRLVRSGYVLASEDYDSFRLIHLICIDWSGTAPYWFINKYACCYDAEKLKKFHHFWHRTIETTVKNEKEQHHHHHQHHADDDIYEVQE